MSCCCTRKMIYILVKNKNSVINTETVFLLIISMSKIIYFLKEIHDNVYRCMYIVINNIKKKTKKNYF